MNFILSIIVVFIMLLFSILTASFVVLLVGKGKDQFIEKTVNKVSSLITSKIALEMDQGKAGPWYLVVYTKDSNYPIWISNNTIRSVHPDPEHCNIIIKQFNGEDMVIENVISYEMRAANKMFDYEM